MRSLYPIIHIIGLPGSGKTTLGKKLSKALRFPIFPIGKYRTRFSPSPIGEADAWVALLWDLSKKKWKNCILETTGLNARENFLKVALPFPQRVIVKLDARRKVLYGRIRKKGKGEQGGEWTFSADYPEKFEFVRKLYKEFKKVPSDITIDTTRLEPQKVFQIALKKIEHYKMMYSNYDWAKDVRS